MWLKGSRGILERALQRTKNSPFSFSHSLLVFGSISKLGEAGE